VLDLTNVISGPLRSYHLALMGADVVKIEVPRTGDLARQMGADPSLNSQQMGTSFLAINAGKRSVTLDLKSAEGKKLFLRLLEDADVVLENFRPGHDGPAGLGRKDAARIETEPDLLCGPGLRPGRADGDAGEL
jgi:formyl-CoA transferase